MSLRSFHLGDFTLDADHQYLLHQGAQLSADPKLVGLLQALAGAYPNAINKQALLDDIWGEVVVSEASLAKLVSESRRLFKQHSEQEVIATVHGKGYRLALAPEWLAAQPTADTTPPPAADTAAEVMANSAAKQAEVSAVALPGNWVVWALAGLLFAMVALAAFVAGAVFSPKQKLPDDIFGRWHVVDNTVVVESGINSDQLPHCTDTVQYYNVKILRRGEQVYIVSPLFEIALGAEVEQGNITTAQAIYDDGTGITHSTLSFNFESPLKFVGKSTWEWRQEAEGEVLCRGISSIVSER